jgi:hypothetical protein
MRAQEGSWNTRRRRDGAGRSGKRQWDYQSKRHRIPKRERKCQHVERALHCPRSNHFSQPHTRTSIHARKSEQTLLCLQHSNGAQSEAVCRHSDIQSREGVGENREAQTMQWTCLEGSAFRKLSSCALESLRACYLYDLSRSRSNDPDTLVALVELMLGRCSAYYCERKALQLGG